MGFQKIWQSNQLECINLCGKPEVRPDDYDDEAISEKHPEVLAQLKAEITYLCTAAEGN